MSLSLLIVLGRVGAIRFEVMADRNVLAKAAPATLTQKAQLLGAKLGVKISNVGLC